VLVFIGIIEHEESFNANSNGHASSMDTLDAWIYLPPSAHLVDLTSILTSRILARIACIGSVFIMALGAPRNGQPIIGDAPILQDGQHNTNEVHNGTGGPLNGPS
jgi:hypothetical protein